MGCLLACISCIVQALEAKSFLFTKSSWSFLRRSFLLKVRYSSTFNRTKSFALVRGGSFQKGACIELKVVGELSILILKNTFVNASTQG